jgi:hypothetical protein
VSTTPSAGGPAAPGRDGRVPPLLRALIDDAAVFPPGNAPLPQALTDHSAHRAAWYADLVGPLLLPLRTARTLGADGPPRLGIICDTGPDGVPAALAAAEPTWRQLEVAVAARGEDPRPGLRTLLAAAAGRSDMDFYAEVPFGDRVPDALDLIADARAGGTRVAPKFRTGGARADLFPTPGQLAEVICGCRDRDLPFKLTAGLHHAVRHTDPATGFTHHGFVNVLAACLAAEGGATVAEVTDLLSRTDPRPLVDTVAAGLERDRPLWIAFGSCSIPEPLADLTALGLLSEGGS